ncbi:MAG: hypothetical protein BWK78_00665 [Thiotrichaceae bacterium IS1]|nr:MAG: hypothetical protein BWK78_00665 [Thiotrichaceae bacterium IS1]
MRLTTVIAVFSLIGCMSAGVPAPAGGNNTGQTKPRAENAQKIVDELFLFKQPIDTSTCADGSDGEKLRKNATTIQEMGAVVFSQVYTKKDKDFDRLLQDGEIGVFVIPYIVNFPKKKLLLVVAKGEKRAIYKDGKQLKLEGYSLGGSFIPPCDTGFSPDDNASFVENNLQDYPILVLSAEREQSFKDFCQDKAEGKFCEVSEILFTTGALLSLVFEKNPPDFLKDIQPGQLKWRRSDNKDNQNGPVEEKDGGSNKTKQSVSLPTQITDLFTNDHAKYLTVEGQGCVLKYPNVECDAQPFAFEKKPVILKIKGFNDIPISLPKGGLKGLNYSIHTQIGETKGTFSFSIDTIGKQACVSVNSSVKLCTEEPTSVRMVVDSETTPVKLTPVKVTEATPAATGKPAGQHKLIVVSLSSGFGPKGKIVQDNLVKALAKLCENKPDQVNFTLLTIESGRKRATVLNSQELADELCQTVGSSADQLLKKIQNGMSFSAEDLRSIDDLELVDSFIADRANSQNANEQVGKVLYLTDDGTLPEKIPRKQLGVPLAWKNDNIVLEVVTTKSCKPWQEQAKVSETLCFQWNQDQVLKSGGVDETTSLSELIETFLQTPK